MSSERRKWFVFGAVGAIAMLADQLSKLWARHALPVRPDGCSIPEDLVGSRCVGEPVSVISNLWDWRLSMNPGSAFGLLSGQTGARVLLSLVAVVAIALITFMLHRTRPDQRLGVWGLALVVGGALGNLLDRIAFGVVTDFIAWRYHEHRWPTFNGADVFLVVGVALTVIGTREPTKKAASAGSSS